MKKEIPFDNDSEIQAHLDANPSLSLRKVSRRKDGNVLTLSDEPRPLSTMDLLRDLTERVQALEGG